MKRKQIEKTKELLEAIQNTTRIPIKALTAKHEPEPGLKFKITENVSVYLDYAVEEDVFVATPIINNIIFKPRVVTKQEIEKLLCCTEQIRHYL